MMKLIAASDAWIRPVSTNSSRFCAGCCNSGTRPTPLRGGLASRRFATGIAARAWPLARLGLVGAAARR